MAPALHSLIIRQRKDVADIMEFLFHKHGDLRKLILEHCWLGDDGTAFLANVVDLYPDLEVLSLADCRQLTPASYGLIPHLKKLSELKLSDWEVGYVYVLQMHICIREACRRKPLEIHFICLVKKEIYFQDMLHNVLFIFHKMSFTS